MKVILKNVNLEFQGKEKVEEVLTPYSTSEQYPTTVGGDGVTPGLGTYSTLKSKVYKITGLTGQLRLRTNDAKADVAIAVLGKDYAHLYQPVVGWNTLLNGLEATINISDFPADTEYVWLLNNTANPDTSQCTHIYYQ